MKSKPFILLFLLLLLFPYAALNKVNSNSSQNSFILPSNIQIQSEDSDTSVNLIKAFNNLVDLRWKEPLKAEYVIETLKEYDNRALISFFSFEERDSFCENARIYNVNIDKIYSPIPAITISYNNQKISEIDFSKYSIKYVYPIGSRSFSVPQNIDVDLGTAVELSDIRRALEIDTLHNLGYTGHGVRIGVLDSGMNFSQAPSLIGQLNYDEQKIISSFKAEGLAEDINDLSGHGTHISSILAGNGKFVIDGEVVQTDDYGIAPDAQLLNIKVLDKTGFGEDEWLIDGFALALDLDSDIISASLTSITFSEIGDPIEELMYAAGRQGVLVVASAGNYGPSGSSIGAPAVWDYVLSIGATQNLQDLALYTASGLNQNFSAGIDILAPGNGIGGSSASDGTVRYVSGTSVSAPIVSGILAVLMEAFPDLKPQNYEIAICETATDLEHPITFQGNGLVNPFAAYQYLNLNQNDTVFTINPKRISPENYHYYECVEGKTTEFMVKLISSDNQMINTSISGDTQFIQTANQYQVYKGWNHIAFNISIPEDTPIREISANILFDNLDGITCDLEISIQTRYFGGSILFDVSLDNDTANQWFDSSSPYGVYHHLARRLKDRGFHYSYHQEGILQASDLENVDILIISDPEYNLENQHLDTIYDFVNNGGSLLFMLNSIRFIDASDVNTDPILSSNYTLCNEILARFDARVFNSLSIEYEPHEAFVTTDGDMFNTDSFFHWGWPIAFNGSSTNNNNEILATFTAEYNEELTDFPAVLATVIGEGRVMIFSSSYPFTDLGLMSDTYESIPQRAELDNSYKYLFGLDSKNSQIVNDTLDWLIAAHRPSIIADWTPERVLIREQITLGFDILKNDETAYLENDTLQGTIIYADHSFEHIIYEKNAVNDRYEVYLTFEEYGWHTVYIPLKFINHTSTDGRIDIFCDVALWDELALIKTITSGVAIFIIATIVLVPLVRSRFVREEPKI